MKENVIKLKYVPLIRANRTIVGHKTIKIIYFIYKLTNSRWFENGRYK
jgi:hypothetical protein